MRNIDDLHPKLQSLVYALQEECKKKGLKIKIGECVRTVKEQNALYAKGRTAPGSIVTNAKGSSYSSMHQWGVAFDFFRDDGTGLYNDKDGFFAKVGKIGVSLGLEWGGNWKSPVDKPHFQLPDWGSTATKLKKLYKTPENFMKTWEDDAMTAQEKKEFDALKKEIEVLKKEITALSSRLFKAEYPMRYGYVDNNMPKWARPTIQKLMDSGLLQGNEKGNLDLSEDLMRMLVVNDRAGLYNK